LIPLLRRLQKSFPSLEGRGEGEGRERVRGGGGIVSPAYLDTESPALNKGYNLLLAGGTAPFLIGVKRTT